jgi:hypothetical protein
LAAACNYQYGAINGFWNGSSNTNGTLTVNAITLNSTPTTNDFVWRGTTSSDYATVANWLQHNGTSMIPATSGPTANTNVILPAAQACVSNQPSLGNNTVNTKNITIESGATLSLGSGTLNTTGNFVNDGTLDSGTGTVAFTGSSAQTIGGSGTNAFYGLTMNNSTGASLTANASVSNMLTLTNGVLDIASYNFDGLSSGVIGGSATSYIKTSGIGEYRHAVSTTLYAFPVGNASYNPCELTKPTGSAVSFGVRVLNSVTADGTYGGVPSSGPNVGRMWYITPGAGYNNTDGVTVGLIYDDNGNYFQNFFSNFSADLRIFHFGSVWEDITDQSGVFNTGAYSIANYTYCRQPGITDFSPFTVSNFGAVLPIELVSFQTNCKDDNTVSVTWVTASEHNTSHYVVEKSRDGITWSVLGQTAAAGNSTELLTYEMIDGEKANGTTYYRLTQFDNDGVYEVFDPVSVNCNGTTTNNHITTYPNPSLDGFYVSLFTETMEGNGQLSIMDGSGRTVYSKSVNIQDGNNVFHIGDLNAAPGMYYIQVTQRNTTTDIVKHSLR